MRLPLPAASKPEYEPLVMDDVRGAEARNGMVVASLFAGAGGSSTGYRLAGYEVAYANDCDPHAAATYSANYPTTTFDPRPVEQVSVEDVLRACGGRPPDVLDGSPPCQSFSTAGRRRVDDPRGTLFGEYARLLGELRPRAFVAENVPGMAAGKMRGIFIETCGMLRSAGYKLRVGMLDAQWLGVPQRRRRLVFVGLRDDVPGTPSLPEPLRWRWGVSDVLPWIGRVVDMTTSFSSSHDGSGLSAANVAPTITKTVNQLVAVEDEAWLRGKVLDGWRGLREGEQHDRYFNLVRPLRDEPSPTILKFAGINGSIAAVTYPVEPRKFSIAELRRIQSFPDDFEMDGSYAERWARIGNSVPPLMMYHVAHRLAGVLG